MKAFFFLFMVSSLTSNMMLS